MELLVFLAIVFGSAVIISYQADLNKWDYWKLILVLVATVVIEVFIYQNFF